MVETSGGSRKFLYIAVCIGNLSAMTAGLSSAWSSSVIPKLSNATELENNPLDYVITKEEQSWVGSLLALGAVFGPLLAGYATDKFGRKNTLLICCGLPLVAAFITLAFAKHLSLYYIARFIGGFAMGGVYTVLPVYNSEISEDSIRGGVSSSMNLFITGGILFSYVIGPYVSIMVFSIICAAIPAFFVIFFFIFAPESPFYLLSVNDDKGAEQCLEKLRGTSGDGIKKELELMKADVEAAKANKASIMDIFKSKGLTKAFIISLSLMAFQQFSGINVILFYAQDIFDATGSSIEPEIASIIIGAVLMGSSFITPVVVDKLGRRSLLLASGIGMVISETPLGIYFYMKDDGQDVDSLFWLPVLCLVMYIITYNIGFGPLPWTVMAEIFPSNIKSAASTVTASFCWFLGFIMTKFFQSVSDSIGMAGSFWLFSGCCVLASIFCLTYLIETKGRSYQEIQDILNGNN